MSRSRWLTTVFVLASFAAGTLALATMPGPGDSPGRGLKRGHRPCFDKGDPPPPCPPCMEYKPPKCECKKIPGCVAEPLEPL